MWPDSVCGEDCFPMGERSMLKEINHNRRNRRRFLAFTAITIAAARVGVTGSARAQSNKTTPADLRAIKVQQMAPAAIRLPIIYYRTDVAPLLRSRLGVPPGGPPPGPYRFVCLP